MACPGERWFRAVYSYRTGSERELWYLPECVAPHCFGSVVFAYNALRYPGHVIKAKIASQREEGERDEENQRHAEAGWSCSIFPPGLQRDTGTAAAGQRGRRLDYLLNKCRAWAGRRQARSDRTV